MGVQVQPPERREAGVAAGDYRAVPDQGGGGEQAHRRDLALLRLCGDHAHGLVQHHAQAGLGSAA